jgi:hypothetical protein
MDAKIAWGRNVKTFWMFMDWMPVHDMAKFRKHCTIENKSDVRREWPIAGKFVRDGKLGVKFAMRLRSFDRDCFYFDFFSFVSEKMRRAMALGPSDIQYFDVDASESAPLPRSKNYQIMHVPVTEDVADLQNSDYLVRHRADGSLEIESPRSVAFRPDARPAHEIFRERSFKQIYCTDELAMRVLPAGCSGAFFVDPSRSTGGKTRFRSLRGVEEIVEWDTTVMRTKLIQKLP